LKLFDCLITDHSKSVSDRPIRFTYSLSTLRAQKIALNKGILESY
jgi:hypothetical protein